MKKIPYGVVVLGNNIMTDDQTAVYLLRNLPIEDDGHRLRTAFQAVKDAFDETFGVSSSRCCHIFDEHKLTRGSTSWFIEVEDD